MGSLLHPPTPRAHAAQGLFWSLIHVASGAPGRLIRPHKTQGKSMTWCRARAGGGGPRRGHCDCHRSPCGAACGVPRGWRPRRLPADAIAVRFSFYAAHAHSYIFARSDLRTFESTYMTAILIPLLLLKAASVPKSFSTFTW